MAKKSNTRASKALHKFWKPEGSVNESNAELFRSWLEKHAEGVDIATFIHSSTHAKKHGKALSALVK
jgi:hypothetical protein